MKPKKIASHSPVPARLSLLGPAPLLEGENPDDYIELLAQISGAVKPTDILEEIWVRDVVDLVLETFRYRRLKTNLLTTNARKELMEILGPHLGWDEAGNLANLWAIGDKDAIERLDKELATAGVTIDAVMAQTLADHIDSIERIDRMVMGTELRRNAVLREIDRHRAAFATGLRQASDSISGRHDVVERLRLTARSAA